MERTAAIIGAISAGIGSDGPKAFQILSKVTNLGDAGKDAERIVDAARHVDEMSVKWPPHAQEGLADELASGALRSRDSVDDALNAGTRFWDAKDGNLVVVEVNPVTKFRAAAVVDYRNKQLVTVYGEARSDLELSKVLTGDAIPRLRYRKIDVP